MGLFFVQKISTSMEVCSSSRIEDDKLSGFSKVCWYAFIRYSISLSNTSLASLFLILDAGVISICSLERRWCILNPLWQLKLKQPSQWFHKIGFSLRMRNLPGAALCSALLDSMLFRSFLMQCMMSWIAQIWWCLSKMSWNIQALSAGGPWNSMPVKVLLVEAPSNIT